jgi:hypothetical protein
MTSLHLANGLRTATMLALLNGGAVDVLPEADLDAFLAACREWTRDLHLVVVHDAPRAPAPARRRAARVARAPALRARRVGEPAPDEMDRLEAALGVPVVAGLSCTETGTIAQQRLSSPRVRGSVGLHGRVRAARRRRSRARAACGHRGRRSRCAVRRCSPAISTIRSHRGIVRRRLVPDGRPRASRRARRAHLEGRLKDTINRGGEKIAPQEIDAVLERVPGVVEAAAFGIEHPALGEEVVAAVVRERGSDVDADRVIAAVRAALGDRRAPRRVWFVDALPRTDSGKLRRGDLPRLLPVNGHARNGEAAPSRASTPLEIAVGALWAEALRCERVGIDDNFFMLGGDSLRGAKLLTQVNAAFGVDLAVPMLFDDANTVAGMARAIERARQ